MAVVCEDKVIVHSSSQESGESDSSLSDSDSHTDSHSPSEREQLLERLDTPKAPAIGRKREVAQSENQSSTQASGKRRRQRCGPSTQLKKKTALECVRQFPDECFTVDGGKLFCSACRIELGLKRSSLRRHVGTSRHLNAKARQKKSQQRQVTVLQSLKRYEERCNHVGKSLPDRERLWRVEVVTAFLRSGVPIAKIDGLRSLLEKNSTRLTGRSHLTDLIPFVLEEEKSSLKAEIQGRSVSLAFDGSTRQGEALAIVLRYLDSNWKIQQRLVRLQIVSKSLRGEQLARLLLVCLSTELQIAPDKLVAAMRDGAAVNTAALRDVKVLYSDILSVVCFCHTIDRAGRLFDTPTLDLFVQWWTSLFAHSVAAKLKWKVRTGQSMKSYSGTRWWSKWEMIKDIFTNFCSVQPFLEDIKEVAPKLRERLLPFFEGDQQRELQLEMAIVLDVGEPFVQATYKLEGDGPLVLTCYKVLQRVATAVSPGHHPNTDSVIQSISDDARQADDLREKARACVKPAVDYFLHKFNVELYSTVRCFRIARIMCPVQVQDLKPTVESVDELRLFPFLDKDSTIAALKLELAAYRAAAEGVNEVDPLIWWQKHTDELPHWSSAVAKVLLVQPSSSAVERVFSLLQQTFSHQQDSSLEDYIEASVMKQYNHRA